MAETLTVILGLAPVLTIAGGICWTIVNFYLQRRLAATQDRTASAQEIAANASKLAAETAHMQAMYGMLTQEITRLTSQVTTLESEVDVNRAAIKAQVARSEGQEAVIQTQGDQLHTLSREHRACLEQLLERDRRDRALRAKLHDAAET